jgi:hypothetical protein
MAAVVIGVDPHKASHTAVAISADEEPLGELQVRASAAQAERLLAWAAAWPERIWAVEGAGGVGHLLAQQLLSAGERVLDVQPKLGARVRLLTAGDTNKNNPSDARSVAVAALRSPSRREATRDDHAAVLKVWSKRHRDLGRTPHPGHLPAARRAVRAGCWRRAQGHQGSARRPAAAIDHAIGGRGGSPLRARRGVRGGPAPHRRPATRDQEEGWGVPNPVLGDLGRLAIGPALRRGHRTLAPGRAWADGYAERDGRWWPRFDPQNVDPVMGPVFA